MMYVTIAVIAPQDYLLTASLLPSMLFLNTTSGVSCPMLANRSIGVTLKNPVADPQFYLLLSIWIL